MGKRAPEHILVLSLLLFCCALPASAQQPNSAPSSETVRVYYIPTVALEEDAATLEMAAIIDSAVKRALERLGLETIAGTNRTPVQSAREANALLIVESSAVVERRELIMSFRAVEAATGRVIAATFVPTLVGVTVHNRINEVVDDLSTRLRRFIENPGDTEEFDPFVLSAEVRTGPDGSRISLIDGRLLAIVEDGVATLPFDPYPVGTSIVIERELEGHHAEENVVTFGESNAVLELRPLWKETEWMVTLHYTLGQIAGLGFGGRYYLDPDMWFVAAKNYFYVQPGTVPNAETVFHNDITIWTGRYFFTQYDSPFRVGLSTGLGSIFTLVPNATPALYTDVYLTIAGLWVEYNTRNLVFSASVGFKSMLGIGNNLLGSGEAGLRGADDESGGSPTITATIGLKL